MIGKSKGNVVHRGYERQYGWEKQGKCRSSWE
jgi:hypothetical protein